MSQIADEDTLNVEVALRIPEKAGSGVSNPSSGLVDTFYNTETSNLGYKRSTGAAIDIGNVVCDDTSLDMECVRFSGTTGKIVEGTGLRHYGASATNPTSPTPQAGDKYYNTKLNHEMCYDGSRKKWLSVATFFEGCGKNGTTTPGTFYRRFNGMPLATFQGPYVPSGTIIRIGYSTAAAAKHFFEILVNGSVITSLYSNGAAFVASDTVNADFKAGIMSCRNSSSSNSNSNLQATIFYKLRSEE